MLSVQKISFNHNMELPAVLSVQQTCTLNLQEQSVVKNVNQYNALILYANMVAYAYQWVMVSSVSVPPGSQVIVAKSILTNALQNPVTIPQLVSICLKDTDANVLLAIPESIVKKKNPIAIMTPVRKELCAKMNLE